MAENKKCCHYDVCRYVHAAHSRQHDVLLRVARRGAAFLSAIGTSKIKTTWLSGCSRTIQRRLQRRVVENSVNAT